ncbi:MAG: 3-oxoacyl-ACP synthase [Paludibacteraceae bacterium]|nr:3-oxoacyl-ACP synthase [Paludibacteraceae bacterium]
MTTAANLEAVRSGKTALRNHDNVHGVKLQEPVVGSFFEELPCMDGYTSFETLLIKSVAAALSETHINAESDTCVFIISTTKGNIWSSPADSAKKVANYFGNKVSPIVVSTACTSGVSAQLAAWRMLTSGRYETAIVVGCDVQSEFIVSGFQSFKALSNELCRPFDVQRKGLNAGEAVATLILSNTRNGKWHLMGGSIHNDANHISGPSRTAEGSLRCLKDMLKLVDKTDLAMISVHGTGTLYNDEMESIAIHRAEMDEIPVSALKGYYGHTMGAAGLLETILTMHALDEGVILPSKGYETQGTTYRVNLSQDERESRGNSFIKLLSGFGGVNAAVAWTKAEVKEKNLTPDEYNKWKEKAAVTLTSSDNIKELYKAEIGNYPKFYKMDMLARLGFVGTELLLKRAGVEPEHEGTAIVMANYSASMKNDKDYEATIEDKNNYFPSPALFVYTLPNIVTGEVAIRHQVYGETAFYVLHSEDEMQQLIDVTGMKPSIKTIIAGWVECVSTDDYYAKLSLLKR